jgi:putative acyl-CoA dehydrogenase
MDTITREPGGGATHEVANQPPPLSPYNAFATSAVLRETLGVFDAEWSRAALDTLGSRAGSVEAVAWGFAANENPPTLKAFDRFGHRVDEVTYHPVYHQLMTVAVAEGLHAASWRDPKPGAQVARAAGFFLWGQTDAGHGCPISMTHAAIPALRVQPELARVWEPSIFSSVYDPQLRARSEKRGVLLGMAMTEKQGGSDVRANTTRATPTSRTGPGEEYTLVGHKWFCSAPMSDAFLVLAQAPAGLSCFLLPRVLPDGTRNVFAIQRLKDKLGNRSNASSEVEWSGTLAYLIGEEGRGVQTIVEMVNFTRLDCIIGSAAGMRQATTQAAHHLAHRAAFGKLLIDQPLAQNVLADLQIEAEAAELTFMRVAQACDRASSDPREAAFKRVATALGKFWVCKRAAPHAAEALECLGGNGYVEESIMPRLYREAPLNSLWEGSGNVNALDVMRILAKEPLAVEAFLHELSLAAGTDARFDSAQRALEANLLDRADRERRARRLVEEMALLLQASLLVRFGNPAVADAFCATRLGGDWGRTFGTLPASTNFRTIVDRTLAPEGAFGEL